MPTGLIGCILMSIEMHVFGRVACKSQFTYTLTICFFKTSKEITGKTDGKREKRCYNYEDLNYSN